jgi:putative transposase
MLWWWQSGVVASLMSWCIIPIRPIHKWQFQPLMTDHGVVCLMSRSGNVWDNAAMESFFSSLKTERTARKTYRTRDDAKVRLHRVLLQSERRHSTIGYMSPVEFEMQAGLA